MNVFKKKSNDEKMIDHLQNVLQVHHHMSIDELRKIFQVEHPNDGK